ncbi:hypothetical protein [Halorientalis sp.]|uniref:hypothetical protein n=1 Tax=Halorientalis sp. TaxID=1931229 RepID=UPI00261BFB27|nr:hypothetical protein [Halorientalis sp.]
MRVPIVGGLLAIVAAGVALAAVGTAGAQSGVPLGDLIATTQRQLGRLAAVQEADESINLVRATGGLAGLGIGVLLGSFVTYLGWRR